MYTSGSTGTPKGVWQNHCGVMHHANVYSELIQVTPEDRLSLLTSCSLAASATPLFAALLNGAMLCPFHVRSQGVERLAIWLREKAVTIYHSVPTVFRQLARITGDNNVFASLRLIRLGGERVLHGDVEIFQQCCPDHCRLMNAFSSTETGLICAAMIDKHTDKHTALPTARVPRLRGQNRCAQRLFAAGILDAPGRDGREIPARSSGRVRQSLHHERPGTLSARWQLGAFRARG